MVLAVVVVVVVVFVVLVGTQDLKKSGGGAI
jgi:hypothetical protein